MPVRNPKVDDIDINAKAAIVLDVATDKILYSKNIDETLPIASLTKLMTALIFISSVLPCMYEYSLPTGKINVDKPTL